MAFDSRWALPQPDLSVIVQGLIQGGSWRERRAPENVVIAVVVVCINVVVCRWRSMYRV